MMNFFKKFFWIFFNDSKNNASINVLKQFDPEIINPKNVQRDHFKAVYIKNDNILQLNQ